MTRRPYVPELRSISNPFDEWQRKQCSLCQVSQTVYICAQIKYNFLDYQRGELSLKKCCSEREDP